MSTQKLAGLFLIVMSLVQVFEALSKHAPPGRLSSLPFAFFTALLFTLGAALMLWGGKWRSDVSHPQS